MSEHRRVCVIGAGSSGLAAARNFKDACFDVDVVERENELGGVWNYSTPSGRVYDSTTMISSKPFTQFPDFPMPDDYPDYPSHGQVLEYLKGYADHFDLLPLIRYGVSVECVRSRNAQWSVTLSDGSSGLYDAVVVANGHNSVPRIPTYPGAFDGEKLHSADYKTANVFADKAVLVIGRGNSGCDIAVDASSTAKRVFSSGRRGYHFVPRYLQGIPSDQVGDAFLKRGISIDVRRRLALAAIENEIGAPEDYGLPAPDHEIFESHPVVNDSFPRAVRDGKVIAKPDIRRLCGTRVEFVDGSVEEIDTLVFATGYKLELPFLEFDDRPVHGRWEPFLNTFHPRHETLFFAGFIQPDSGQFGLVHWQMRCAALVAANQRGHCDTEALAKATLAHNQPGGPMEYLRTPRHMLEVEHWSYLNALREFADRVAQ